MSGVGEVSFFRNYVFQSICDSGLNFEIFGVVFEDDPGKILLWGHSNSSSPIIYLSFEIL